MIHQELWSTLQKLDPWAVSRRSLAVYDENQRGYRLTILSKDYCIIPSEGKIQSMDAPDEQCHFFLQLTAVNYLIGAKDIPLDGRWASEKEFPSGPLFFRGPHALPSKKLTQIFGLDSYRFAEACRNLGGKSIDSGDSAFELLVLPRIPVRLILWLADEEFPARLTYLFDRTANVHLKLDAIWAVGNLIEVVLVEGSSNAPQKQSNSQ
ncbi:MAG: DUF3786 domain-containing protein [Candidatus Aminicenantes bacterium]|nr:DUF3786 domain-containing protein [Candidatus Aminicenantes bacterium]